jgi:hypothetical protein
MGYPRGSYNKQQKTERRELAIHEAQQRLHEAEETAVIKRDDALDRFDDIGHVQAFITMLDAEALQPQQKAFLGCVALTGVITTAVRMAGVALRTTYDWRKDTEFEDMFQEAKKIAGDRLEYEAVRLATGHYEKPVVSLGKVVAYERIFDNKLMLALLRKHKPEEFGSKVDITSNGQSIVKYVDKDAWESI